mgnify:CR=1 FL=1
MTTRLRQWLCLAGWLCAAGTALAQGAAPAAEVTATPDAQTEILQALPQAKLMGTSRLTVWGFQVYDARLWAPASFAAGHYATSPLALELRYLRDFKALDIAERSLQEMRRSQPISNAQAALWKADMLRVIPDVKRAHAFWASTGQGAARTSGSTARPAAKSAMPNLPGCFSASGCRRAPPSHSCARRCWPCPHHDE